MDHYNREESGTIGEVIDRVNRLTARREALLGQLQKSAELQRLVPGLFRHGPAISQIIGNPTRPTEMKYVVTDARGEETTFPLSEVPEILWVHMRRQFREQCMRTMIRCPRIWLEPRS